MLGLSSEIFNGFVDNGKAVDNSYVYSVVIRVFVRGSKSYQQEKFSHAMVNSGFAWDDQLTYLPIEEYLDTDGAKKFGWSIVEIVDWLLEDDIHFILNHIHQGMNYIDCRSININLQPLYHHPGFPNNSTRVDSYS